MAEDSIDGTFPVNQRVQTTTAGDSLDSQAFVDGNPIAAPPFSFTTKGAQMPEPFMHQDGPVKIPVTGATATLREVLNVTLLVTGDQVSFPGSADTGIAPVPVPEPSIYAIFVLAIIGLLAYRGRAAAGIS